MKRFIALIVILLLILSILVVNTRSHKGLEIVRQGTVTTKDYVMYVPENDTTNHSKTFTITVPTNLGYVPEVMASMQTIGTSDYIPLPFTATGALNPTTQAQYTVVAHADKNNLYINVSMWGNTTEGMAAREIRYTLLKAN